MVTASPATKLEALTTKLTGERIVAPDGSATQLSFAWVFHVVQHANIVGHVNPHGGVSGILETHCR